MPDQRPRSAGVTAAATLLILYSVSALLLWGYFFIPLLNQPPDKMGRHIYEQAPIPFALVAVVPPALIAVGIRIAVGVFHLKPWARTAMLAGALITTAICLVVVARWPFETFVIPHHFVTPLQAIKQRLLVSFVIMLLPVNVWWVFLFRMESVKTQFSLPAESSAVTAPAAEEI